MKKTYLKPSFEAIAIDRDISLVMMTNEYTPPGGPRGAPAPGASSELTSPSEIQSTPFSKEP